MSIPEAILNYAKESLERLVSIPSVAAEGRGIPEAASLTRELLEAEGLQAEVHQTAGAPVVYAEKVAPSGPTILFYNHYDVQPADPVELWDSDPFSLVERDGKLYGRGVADDKGELVSRLAALRHFKDKHGDMPFTVKFVVEGEEEIGSPNLATYVETHKHLLQADACIWEFGGVDAMERPMTYCGLKGILTLELRLRTAGHDLHSSLGAVVENPIYRLAKALASLRDEQGKVLIEGFYDDVLPPTSEEEALLAALPEEDDTLAKVFGVSGFIGGVHGSTFRRQLLFEPVVNINGFHAGYGGSGSKTVLPAEATAKLDVRLVPAQDPQTVLTLLEAHLLKKGFDDIDVRVLEHSEHAARSDVTHPWVQTTIAGLRDVYGTEPVVYPNSAGSGPMHPFIEHLELPIVGLGCGYPGSRIHSPNEHVRIRDLERGIQAVVRVLERYILET